MDRNEGLRQNRRNYWESFFLGFGRGRGLFSILLLAAYQFLKRKQLNNPFKSSNKEGKGPEQFETIYEPSEKISNHH